MSKKTLSVRELIGEQSPFIFTEYVKECQELVKGEREFLWILMKVFLYGRIIGIRHERARRKRGVER